MKITDGTITEATEAEMFNYWRTRGYEEIFDFPEFLERCQRLGTTIVDAERGCEIEHADKKLHYQS